MADQLLLQHYEANRDVGGDSPFFIHSHINYQGQTPDIVWILNAIAKEGERSAMTT